MNTLHIVTSLNKKQNNCNNISCPIVFFLNGHYTVIYLAGRKESIDFHTLFANYTNSGYFWIYTKTHSFTACKIGSDWFNIFGATFSVYFTLSVVVKIVDWRDRNLTLKGFVSSGIAGSLVLLFCSLLLFLSYPNSTNNDKNTMFGTFPIWIG